MFEDSDSDQNALLELLGRIERGELTAEEAVQRVASVNLPMTAPTFDARLDLDRRRRCGYPEVVFAQGKTAAAVVEIFETLFAHGEDCFATRVCPEQAAALLARFPGAIHNSVARTVRMEQRTDRKRTGFVAVITAGTSDRPVAEEALETLGWMGCETDLIVDVGVAGPHRLQEQRDRYAHADAIVVVAGMEGALPSVVGGCVSCPVVAVPTSVGYGASFSGIAALLGMLNSCAANVTVVNIDAGFKGGYIAGLIARQTAKKP
ncbi:MAG: nickel pincer cofactor biosynthesis protein LarB [Thermoanaerobaculia bacterium]